MEEFAVEPSKPEFVLEDITKIIDIARKQNPELNKFKKVSVSDDYNIINSIPKLFGNDIIEDVGSINEFNIDKEGVIKYKFKLINDDFAVVYNSFAFWFRVVILFYNDEKKLKKQFTDKIFENILTEEGIYRLYRSAGGYYLSKAEPMDEEPPELDGNMFNNIIDDINLFFENEDFYNKNNLIFKRGILLYGPPGNGKSSIIKNILAENKDKIGIIINQDVIEYDLNKFLNKVSKDKDKIIVIEDIDSVPDYNRSTLLNFLDGVDGLDRTFIIATTNYLSKLDPAICNRPSRFDKTYHFSVPSANTREKIIKRYFKGIDEKKLKEATEQTDGFSGAYIKELFIQCGTQKIDIIDAIKSIKKRTEDYTNYKEPTYYG
jgi:hypothetical protein